MKKNEIIATSGFGREMRLISIDKIKKKAVVEVNNTEHDLALFLKFCVSERWDFTSQFLKETER